MSKSKSKVEIVLELYKKFLENPAFEFKIQNVELELSQEELQELCRNLNHISYTDHKNFSKSGHFITWLVEISPCRDIRLEIGEFEEKIDYLGYCFNKQGELTVVGNVGNYFGACANSGIINLKGDYKNYAFSRMYGGHNTIVGNGGDFTCSYMKGGYAELHGNNGIGTGWEMLSGRLKLFGESKKFLGAYMKDGKIHACGNPGIFIGSGMEGGLISVDSGPIHVSSQRNGGIILHNMEFV